MKTYSVYSKKLIPHDTNDLVLIDNHHNRFILLFPMIGTPTIYFFMKKMWLDGIIAALILVLIISLGLEWNLEKIELYVLSLLYNFSYSILAPHIEEEFLLKNSYVLRDISIARDEESALIQYINRIKE